MKWYLLYPHKIFWYIKRLSDLKSTQEVLLETLLIKLNEL